MNSAVTVEVNTLLGNVRGINASAASSVKPYVYLRYNITLSRLTSSFLRHIERRLTTEDSVALCVTRGATNHFYPPEGATTTHKTKPPDKTIHQRKHRENG